MEFIKKPHFFLIAVILIKLCLPVFSQSPSFYLNASGINGSNNFSDSGPNNYPVSVNGNPINSSICNNTAVYINGQSSSNYLFSPPNPDFNLGSGDFTIHFWVYLENITSTHAAFDLRSAPGQHVFFIHYPGTGWTFSDRQGPGIIVSQTTPTMMPQVWTHVALVRTGNIFSIYINGCQVATAFSTTSIFNSSGLTIGYSADNFVQFNGYLDEFYIYKGSSLWANNFVVPGCSIFASCISCVAPYTSSVSKLNVKCNGDSTGSITVSSSGGMPPYNYQWSGIAFGQTGPTAIGLPAGTTTVIVTDQSCLSDTQTVIISEPPALLLDVNATDTLICFGENITLTSIVSGGTLPYSYFWSNNSLDSAQIVSPAITTNYTVTVTDSNSCSENKFVQVEVNTLVALYTASDVCKGDTVHLTNNSSSISGSIVSHNWDFGDGTSSAQQSPAYLYDTSGTFNVKLKITSDKGCSDSSTASITIHPNPDAQFFTLNFCDKASILFNDSSSIFSTDTIQSWTWDFGDGSPFSTNQNSSHLYNAIGSYSSKLMVVSNFGCSDSITKTTIVYPKPLSDFINTIVCSNDSTQYTDSSVTASGSISMWFWNFGDGSSISSAQNPAHLYPGAGNYNTTLIVNNSFGCADTIAKPVQINYNPIAGFTFNDICFQDTMHFINTSSVDTSTSIANYLWLFGDAGPTSSLPNPNHYYSNAGTYTVALVVTTVDGCANAFTFPVKVFDTPTSAFTFSNSCLFDSAVFTNTSLDPTMGITSSWSWNFGDGSALNTTVLSPNHLYAAPGNYQVTLITQSSNLGCADTLTDNIIVFPKPVADFNFTDVCLNQLMNFSDSSNVLSGIIAGWVWNFGDGTPIITVQNPSHVYANSGTYLVSLIATTNNSCNDTAVKSVIVHPLPVVQFSRANVCEGSVVAFSNLSTILTTDTIQSQIWNFGDGSAVNSNQNASHLYSTNGSYSVQLFVISSFGCGDSVSKITIINPNPVVNFISNDTIGCEPLCVNFQNLSSIPTGLNVSQQWNFGDSSPINTSQNPNYCYSNDSLYSQNSFMVSLIVTSDSGCVTTRIENNYITVFPNPNAAFTATPTIATITDPVISFTNLSSGTNYWNWNLGDTDTSSSFMPLPHAYADIGNYTIALITSNQFNCTDTAFQTIVIEPDFLFYIPNAFTPDGDGVNDTFIGKGVFIKEFEMTIFDRWGNLIYKTTDINKPWDGKANRGNEIAQGDVYIYVVKIIDIKDKSHGFKGVVTLLK
ncbi:MAG: PKD domain-containing protein [Bacteroidota bacterium]